MVRSPSLSLLMLLTACGPDIWDVQESRSDGSGKDLLGQDEASEEMWIPPDQRGDDDGGGGTFDAAEAAATFEDFQDGFEELYCALLYECGYGITESQCLNYFADYWDEECEAYPADWGYECLVLLDEADCAGLEDGSTMIACQPVQDACSAAVP